MIKIAALQASSLPLDRTRLNHYLYVCHTKGIKVVTLGEYTLNLFFKELEQMPTRMIKEQSLRQIETLKTLAAHYELTIVAPVVLYKHKKLYKAIGKFAPKSSKYYYQRFLIDFPHWSEKKFFAGDLRSDKPMFFTQEKIKFAVIGGYELHFDTIWLEILNNNTDVVLMPTASTFDSYHRWRELSRMRAYLNSLYILRVNRIGKFTDDQLQWIFYGDTFLAAPDGEIDNELGDKEELMIAQIDKKILRQHKKLWRFRDEQF
jgi:nitrilase